MLENKDLKEMIFGFGTVTGVFNQLQKNNILTGTRGYTKDPQYGIGVILDMLGDRKEGQPINKADMAIKTLGPSGSGKTFATTSKEGIISYMSSKNKEGGNPQFSYLTYYATPVLKQGGDILREIFTFFVRRPKRIINKSKR